MGAKRASPRANARFAWLSSIVGDDHLAKRSEGGSLQDPRYTVQVPSCTLPNMYPSVVCAWCQQTLKTSKVAAPISHGICLGCLKSTEAMAFEELGEFSQAELDELPLGVVELDREGRVQLYNKTEGCYSGLEPERVVGKHFFRRIAPCAAVAEFEGRFDTLVQTPGPRREHLDFVFSFASGDRLASITMNWDPRRDRVTLLIELST